MEMMLLAIVGSLGAAAMLAAAWLVWDRARLTRTLADALAQHAAAEARADDLGAQRDSLTDERGTLTSRVETLRVEAAELAERARNMEQAHAQRVEQIEKRYAALDRERAERQDKAIADLDQRTRQAFDALAAKALKSSTDQFLKYAEENFAKHRQQAASELDQRRKSFAELIAPIGETLKKTDERLGKLDQSRAEAQAALAKHLELLATQTRSLHEQTGALVRSLKAPQVRGRWGELTLRRVAELSGMSEHCDFAPQHTVANDEGQALRPDMVIRLPGGRTIVVDAKTPLSAYLEAIEADTDERRADRLRAHARQLRDRVKELADKKYQASLDSSPDFTVLFVPGDQFLSAALLETPDLLEDAAARGVILTTPATMVALMKAVSFGWQQASLADDARDVLKLGRDLHARVGVLSDHLTKLGTHLGRSVDAYNKAVGSYESRLQPAARQLADRHAASAKDLTEPNRLAITARQPANDTPGDNAPLVETNADTPAHADHA